MDWPAPLRAAWSHVLVRYVVVGAANTSFSYAVYALALALGCRYPLASLITLVAGICLSFLTQGRLVFRNMRRSLFGRFVVSWALIYAAHVGVVALCLHLGYGAFIGGALAMPSNVIAGFLLQRYFVFGASYRESGQAR
jgi:putative flippase GtrA